MIPQIYRQNTAEQIRILDESQYKIIRKTHKNE